MKQKLHSDLNTLLDFYRKNRENRPKEFTHKAGLISKPGFFGLIDFQKHLNNPLLKPEWIHIKRNGKTVPTDEAVHSKIVQMRDLHFMDKAIIDEEIEKGAALVLEGLDILDPGINAFCAMLEKGLPCGMANSVVFFLSKRQ